MMEERTLGSGPPIFALYHIEDGRTRWCDTMTGPGRRSTVLKSQKCYRSYGAEQPNQSHAATINFSSK